MENERIIVSSASKLLEVFMKLRLSHLALLVALPSVVCAGSYMSFAKEVRFVTASESERLVVKQAHSYDLAWSKTAGKFEARSGDTW